MAKAGRSRVPVKLEAAGDTHIGGRTHNEDAILLRPDLNLFLVADGAGGQNAGNVAASLAITTIAHFFEQTQDGAETLPAIDGLGLHTPARRLSAAVQEANKEILAIAQSSDKHKGMGTTIVAAHFDLERRLLHVAYVGDSRCYRLRDGRLEQLSHDHSLINDVLELRPNISDERVKKLPQNVITRALGMMENLRVSVRSHEVTHGDRYLLCTDGLSDNIDDGQIHESLALDIGCDEQVALLVSLALEAGASDNVASVIVDCSLPSSSMSPKASTRPIKKKSRPKLPRIDVSSAASSTTVTEDSVPEIVLYDRPESRDSSPLIHVVPEASRSPDVMQAFRGVLPEDDQVTKEYESPLAAMDAIADPTGGEPPLRGPAQPRKPPSADPPREPSTKVMETDHAALRQAAGGPIPDPIGDDDDDDTDQPTRAFPRKTPGAFEFPRGPSQRGKKAKAKAKAKPAARPKATRAKAASPKPRTTMTPGAQAAAKRATSGDGTERGGAAAAAAGEPRTRETSAEKRVSAPRRNKPNVSASPSGSTRSGDTKGPGDSESPPSPKLRIQRPPPMPRTERMTLTGPLPSAVEDEPATTSDQLEISSDMGGLPLPPVREPFDTSDFTNDSVPCHACGSIIMRTADLCMYCGAPTGFVRTPKGKGRGKK